MFMKKTIAGVLAAALLCVFMTAAQAAESEDMLSITYVAIAYNGIAVDSLNGVEAYYNRYSPNFQCTEYVTRYYDEVYGVVVNTTGSGPDSGSEGYQFELAEEPKAGDIVFAAAGLRGKSYNHWAIVKNYQDGIITLIEQNWRWNGQAGVERQMVYPSQYYEIYTLTDDTGRPVPTLLASETAGKAEGYGLVPVANNLETDLTREGFCDLALSLLLSVKPNVELVNEACDYNDTNSFVMKISQRLGLIEGGPDGLFRPDDTITWQEGAVILERLIQTVCEDMEQVDAKQVLSGMAGMEEVEYWAEDAMATLAQMVDLPEGFNPRGNITKQDALFVMVGLYEALCPEEA